MQPDIFHIGLLHVVFGSIELHVSKVYRCDEILSSSMTWIVVIIFITIIGNINDLDCSWKTYL